MLVLISADDDTISFEERVALVVGKMILIEIVVDNDGRPLNNFAPVANGYVVWERELAKSMEGEEAREQLGDK